ncbi:hypothetical protein [Brevundimonas nasdae]|uniref:hypothetical protein n=1 Tax=Brevundimonas nasdae TaxID=172043 RepID=UPI003F68DFCC
MLQQNRPLFPEPTKPVSTDDLVDRFAAALKDKLRTAEAKYGRNNDWLETDWRDELIAHLQHHITKGDPRDVAAYCAFAWHHGWSLSGGPSPDSAHLGWLMETDDGTEWIESDPRHGGEGQHAKNIRPLTLQEAKNEMLAAWAVRSELEARS